MCLQEGEEVGYIFEIGLLKLVKKRGRLWKMGWGWGHWGSSIRETWKGHGRWEDAASGESGHETVELD